MQPLTGIHVVNLAANLPGPAAARRLQLLGAEVIKVEAPAGDPMEIYQAQWYRDMCAGQMVMRLDLKQPVDREKLDRLLSEADLLISATRPAAMERLGLDWPSLQSRFPRLCMLAITGYPEPHENEAGHDLTYQASLGLLTPPYMPRTLLADMAGAEQALTTGLTLLLARERGQAAGYACVPLSEAAAWMAQPLAYGCTTVGANLGGGIPEYNIYPARTGWIAVAALEPHFKERLESALGITSPEEYRQAFMVKDATEWKEWARERDIPIAALTGTP
jgi:crotonobetainyl-CoA:carnitine CoA-transferase CaiB-like acyl-CoA transferase